MKTTAHLFGGLAVFLAIDIVIYWFTSYDPTGTAALFMAFCMSGMISLYLLYTAWHTDPGPDDRADAEPYEGAGEQGFFSPHSWWPFTMALGAAGMFTGIAVGFWLCYFAAPFFAYGVYGLVFEYYRGENKRY